MPTDIYDLTEEFKSPTIAWDARGRAFRSQFPETVSGLRRGLYASTYANPSPLRIYDRNGPGKVFALEHGNTFKYGKFEGGVAERHQLNHVHLHRRPAGPAEEAGIFRDSLQLLLVLDLSDVDVGAEKSAPKAFEAYWNRSIRAFLEAHGFADGTQDGRSESRYLARIPTKSQLMPLLRGLCDQILAAARTSGGWRALRQR